MIYQLLLCFTLLLLLPTSFASWHLSHFGPTPCSESTTYPFGFSSSKYWYCSSDINQLNNCPFGTTHYDVEKGACMDGGGRGGGGEKEMDVAIIAFYGDVMMATYLLVTIQVATSEEGGVTTTLSLPPGFSLHYGYMDCGLEEGNVTCYTDTYHGLPSTPCGLHHACGTSIFLLKSFARDTQVHLYLSSSNPSPFNTTMNRHISFSCIDDHNTTLCSSGLYPVHLNLMSAYPLPAPLSILSISN